MAQTNRARLFVLTGSVAAVTATGAWYGAGLKTRQEFHQERKQVVESTTADKIAQLERVKARLEKERAEMAAKIERLTASAASSSPSSPVPETRTVSRDESSLLGVSSSTGHMRLHQSTAPGEPTSAQSIYYASAEVELDCLDKVSDVLPRRRNFRGNTILLSSGDVEARLYSVDEVGSEQRRTAEIIKMDVAGHA